MIALLFAWLFSVCFTTIEPGTIGVDVQDGMAQYEPMQPGMSFTLGHVVTYPTTIRTASDRVCFRTTDAVLVCADVLTTYNINPDRATTFYNLFKYKDLDSFEKGILHQTIATGFFNASAKYSLAAIRKDCSMILSDTMEEARPRLNSFGVHIHQINIINLVIGGM